MICNAAHRLDEAAAYGAMVQTYCVGCHNDRAPAAGFSLQDAYTHSRIDPWFLAQIEDLVAEADSVSVDGWDFSWLDGRATEDRPSWGYQGLLRRRLGEVSAALDLHTGGGEVLAGAGPFPPTMAAAESWPSSRGEPPASISRRASGGSPRRSPRPANVCFLRRDEMR